MAVHPSFRGQGISTKLGEAVYQEAEQQHIVFTIGFSNEQGIKVDQHAKNYKYHILGKFQTYTTILPTILWKTTNINIRTVSFEEYLSVIKDSIIPFWTIDKNILYLKWRFSLLSTEKQQFLVINKGITPIGVAIIVNTNKQIFIQNVVPFHDNDIPQLIKAVVTFSRHIKPIVSIQIVNTNYWRKMLLPLGFVPRKATHSYWLTLRKHTVENIPNIDDANYWWLMSGDLL